MIIIRLQGNILHRLCRRVAFDISGVQILHSGSEAYNEKNKVIIMHMYFTDGDIVSGSDGTGILQCDW